MIHLLILHLSIQSTKAGYYSMLVWSKNSTLFTLFIIDNLEGWEIDELKKIANKIDYVYKD